MSWRGPAWSANSSARIEPYTYALIQLNDDWDSDEYDASLTENILAALEQPSTQVNESDATYYRAPLDCGKRD